MPKIKAKVVPYAKLKAFRAEMGLSMKDMAKIIGITEGSYLAKENGQRPFTSVEMRIVKKFSKRSADELFFD